MSETKHTRSILSIGAILGALALPGCFSAVSLNKVVVAYDDAVTDALSKQLLVNIARAEHRQRFTSPASRTSRRPSTFASAAA